MNKIQKEIYYSMFILIDSWIIPLEPALPDGILGSFITPRLPPTLAVVPAVLLSVNFSDPVICLLMEQIEWYTSSPNERSVNSSPVMEQSEGLMDTVTSNWMVATKLAKKVHYFKVSRNSLIPERYMHK